MPGRGGGTQCSYTGGHVPRVGPASPWLLAPSADGFDTGVCVYGMSEGIPQCQRLPSHRSRSQNADLRGAYRRAGECNVLMFSKEKACYRYLCAWVCLYSIMYRRYIFCRVMWAHLTIVSGHKCGV